MTAFYFPFPSIFLHLNYIPSSFPKPPHKGWQGQNQPQAWWQKSCELQSNISDGQPSSSSSMVLSETGLEIVFWNALLMDNQQRGLASAVPLWKSVLFELLSFLATSQVLQYFLRYFYNILQVCFGNIFPNKLFFLTHFFKTWCQYHNLLPR